ncbi:MAG: cupredoxin domain-containing protein [Chloroflexi bacterium]|nr:cupredoxin domain-containing protein [Chloroflexota bacterium]
MRLRLPAAVVVLFLLLALALAGCGDGSPSGPDVTLTPIAPVDGVLTVRAFEWGFEPGAIALRQGEEVRIVLVNDGKILHNWKVEGLEADVIEAGDADELFVEAAEGEEGTLVFVPQASGSFTFYCTISGHRRLGMEGILTVAP